MTPKTVVVLSAVDWGMYAEQTKFDHEFDMIHGQIVGFLVREDDEMIVLAPQWFNGTDVRFSLVVPKVCITQRQDILIANADLDSDNL